MDDPATEYELALRARDGDREALAELVERTRLRLFALAYAELRHYEDAQDAVAAALLQICRHVGELRQPERARAWMQTIVRNEAHRLRRGEGRPIPGPGEAEPQGDFAEPSLLRLEIERALRRLPGEQARAVRLFYLAELSTREIARRLGRAEGTVTSWLHRARRQLAAYFCIGVDPLVRKAAPAEIDRLAAPIRRRVAGWKQLTENWQALTERARRALYFAQEEATRRGERYVGTEHLLLGLMREKESLAARALAEQLAIAPDRVRAGIERQLARGEASVLPASEPTPRAARVMDLALEEARALGLAYVGTEHLLLGLIREEDGCGGKVLRDLGAGLERTRRAIRAMLES